MYFLIFACMLVSLFVVDENEQVCFMAGECGGVLVLFVDLSWLGERDSEDKRIWFY